MRGCAGRLRVAGSPAWRTRPKMGKKRWHRQEGDQQRPQQHSGHKKQKRQQTDGTASWCSGGGAGSASGSIRHPFEVDVRDHCETSPTAYTHIAPILALLAQRLGKQPADLAIYDPYYCAGAAVRHLQGLGFPRVHNRNDDFYATIASGSVPEHDVVVTNPPYTGDHVQKLLKFLHSNGKPSLILMPDYFGDDGTGAGQSKGTDRQRSSWQETLGKQEPVLLCPRERYQYHTPRELDGAAGGGGSSGGMKKGHKTLPFLSYWHIVLRPVMDHTRLLDDDDDDAISDDEREREAGGEGGAGGEGDGAEDAEDEFELAAGCRLFGGPSEVAKAGWGRGQWPYSGGWVSKKHRKASGATKG